MIGATANRIKAEQISAVSANAITGAISGIAGASILAVALIAVQKLPGTWIIVWLAAVTLVLALQIIITLRQRRDKDGDYRRWATRFTILAFVSGMMWGCGVVATAASGGIDTELLVLMVSSGIAAGAGLSYGSFLPTFYARFLPTNVPYVIWSICQIDALHGFLALFTVVFMAGIMQLVRQYNKTVAEMLRLRFENVDLVSGLRQQTEVANLANITKSRFLAAASHDLRQPVHALNLFVGALQGRPMDSGTQRLVTQIDRSVAALDNLFVSLLDVSKLDAGIVALQMHDFKIQPLLERVCNDHAAEAKLKGVQLVLMHCSSVVRADPILLERILRNLVSNAVRYTMTGRVVVGCRRRSRLSIEVWDTGPGIAVDEQKKIFQEFYQIANAERDRQQGIGLGLAIVKRLSDLLACDLAFNSQVGSGSVFKISVPFAEAPPAEAHVTAPPSLLLATGLVLVIDDEVAIQDAMASLLSSWGHETIVAGSGDEMLERIGLLQRRPDAIVCDLRLRNNENGIDVVQRLHSEFNHDIPTVLITGDTAPDRLKEAQASGLPLLHKPIHNSVLQMTIVDLLRDAEALPRSAAAGA
jgi:signal transduction histidine kinase/CheY-like chemotaxis protein